MEDSFDCVIVCDTLPPVYGIRDVGYKNGLVVIGDFKHSKDRIPFIEAGADALLDCPFDKQELRAVVINKMNRNGGQRVIKADRLEMDVGSRTVKVDGVTVHLTNKELLIVECLLLHVNTTVTHERVLSYMYGLEEPNSDAYPVILCKLRAKFKKFKVVGTQPYEPIKTMWGNGLIITT